MGYSSDILIDRITIQNRKEAVTNKFGLDAGGISWEDTCQDLAEVTWSKGKQALNAGAIDAYACVLVRMRWNPKINMRSRIVYDGQVYAILPETFHANYFRNTIQFNAQLLINDKNYDPDENNQENTQSGNQTGSQQGGPETGANSGSEAGSSDSETEAGN